MLYFDENIYMLSGEQFLISNKYLLRWAPTKHLRPLNLCDAASRVAMGFNAAVNFSVGLKAI